MPVATLNVLHVLALTRFLRKPRLSQVIYNRDACSLGGARSPGRLRQSCPVPEKQQPISEPPSLSTVDTSLTWDAGNEGKVRITNNVNHSVTVKIESE